MSDIEGMSEAIGIMRDLMNVFASAMGWTVKKGMEEGIGVVKGVGKQSMKAVAAPFKLAITTKQRKEFLRGGEANLEAIFKEKGTPADTVVKIRIPSWEHEKAKALLQGCEKIGVKICPLRDMDPSDDEIQFLYHSSDAGRLEAAINYIKGLHSPDAGIEYETVTAEEYFETLPDKTERETEIRNEIQRVQTEREATLSPEEKQQIKSSSEDFIEHIAKEERTKKNARCIVTDVPASCIKLYSFKDENGIETHGFAAIVTEDGVASVPSHAVRRKNSDTLQVVIDPEQSYPFQEKNGEIKWISGTELQKHIDKLRQQKEMRDEAVRIEKQTDKLRDNKEHIPVIETKKTEIIQKR